MPGPHSPHGGTANALYSVAFLTAAIWLNGRLKKLQAEQDYAGPARFASTVFAPLGICAVGVALAGEWYVVSVYMALLRHGSVPPHLRLTPAWWHLLPPFGVLFYSVVGGLVMGGVVGSLKRVRSGDAVTGDTFFRDAVRYFKPLSAMYLLIGLLGILPYTPSTLVQVLRLGGGLRDVLYSLTSSLFFVAGSLLALASPLLMLVPYVAVDRDVGAWQAIGRGLREWFSNAWAAVSFVCLGISFVVVPLAVWNIARELSLMVAGRGWSMVPSYALGAAVGCLVTAFMSVAVWEFYWRITASQGDNSRLTADG